MGVINNYNSYKKYSTEYDSWRTNRDIKDLKKNEFIKNNPESVNLSDIQKNKTLLRAIDIMDEYTYKKTENLEVITGSVINVALQYTAVGGVALGYLLTKLKPIKNTIHKIAKNNNRTVRLLNTTITTLSAVASTIVVFPFYNWANKAESKAFRKTRHEVMRKELINPKIFATLTPEQEAIFEKNIEQRKKTNILKKSIKSFKEKVNDLKNYSKDSKEDKINKKLFERNLFENIENKNLTEKEIEYINANKHLIIDLVDKINCYSQDYQEKAEIATNIAITSSFALGSLIALAYERLAKKFKININTLPANLGLFLMLGTTLVSASLQNKASHVGRFKIKQELMKEPEIITYIPEEKFNNNDELNIKRKKITIFDYLKTAFIDYIQYEKWKKETFSKEKNIDNAFRNIDLSEEQLIDAKNMQKNTFRVFSKLDDNTQKHAESITVIGQAIQYPITLVFNTLASIFGVKHLTSLSKATSKKDILSSSIKYVLTILALTTPSLLINTKIIKDHKKALQISDMLTIKDLESSIDS